MYFVFVEILQLHLNIKFLGSSLQLMTDLWKLMFVREENIKEGKIMK